MRSDPRPRRKRESRVRNGGRRCRRLHCGRIAFFIIISGSADVRFKLVVLARLLHHADVRAQRPELVHNALVAPLDILHAADLRLSLRGQRRDDQRRRSQAWIGAPVRWSTP